MRKSWRKTYCAFAILLAALSYVWLASFVFQGTLFAFRMPGGGDPVLSDFVINYNAGVLSRKCLEKKLNIYDAQEQARSYEPFINGCIPEKPFYMQYPPSYWALALPLSVLPIWPAWFFWCGVAIIALVVCTRWIMSDRAWTTEDRRLMAVWMAASFPLWLTFRLGQTSLFNFAAVLLVFYLLKRRNFLWAGVAAALVTIKIQYSPIVFLIGLILGRLRFGLGFAAGVAALYAYTFAILGWENIVGYPHALLEGETSAAMFGVWPDRMQDMRGELSLLTHNQSRWVNPASSILFVLAGLVMGGIWYKFNPLRAAVAKPSDTKLAEATAPDRTAPDTKAVDSKAAGANEPDTNAPDTKGADTKESDTNAPNTKEPHTKALETGALSESKNAPTRGDEPKMPSMTFKLLTALTAQVLLIFGLHTHAHDLVLMILPCLWMWEWTLYYGETHPLLRQWIRTSILLFPFWGWIGAYYRPQLMALYIQPFLSWMVIIFVLNVIVIVKMRAAMMKYGEPISGVQATVASTAST